MLRTWILSERRLRYNDRSSLYEWAHAKSGSRASTASPRTRTSSIWPRAPGSSNLGPGRFEHAQVWRWCENHVHWCAWTYRWGATKAVGESEGSNFHG